MADEVQDTGTQLPALEQQAIRSPLYAPHCPEPNRGLFYSLDPKLLELIQTQAEGALVPELLELEISQAEESGRHDSRVGTWKGRPVSYRFLAQLPSITESIGTRPVNWKSDPFWWDLDWYDPNKVKGAEDKVNWNQSMSSAYCGWLLTDPGFCTEHDAFFTTFQVPIREIGGLPPLDGREMEISDALKPCRLAYQALCARWELAGLVGPYLPIPLQPRLPVPAQAIHLLPAMVKSGGVFMYFPRTHPIPNRKELRERIEHALSRASAPDHIKAWVDLIDAENPGKNGLHRYVRLFRLQHWWRLIHHRHAPAVIGRIERLQKAFGIFLIGDDPDDKNFETIRNDLGFISKRLGRGWHNSQNCLQLFS
jgi:hypothetical protein